MKVKTYGISGLSEWHGKLKAGTLEVSVSFTGGTASPSGAQPAYFMTRDPIVQFVVENSKEFKSGFIALVMQQDVAGEHPRMAVPKKSPVVKSSEEGIESSDAEPAASGGETPVDGIPLKVRVADKYDAIEYLKEHFPDKNYTSSGLRTTSAFEAACNECGVVFAYDL